MKSEVFRPNFIRQLLGEHSNESIERDKKAMSACFVAISRKQWDIRFEFSYCYSHLQEIPYEISINTDFDDLE